MAKPRKITPVKLNALSVAKMMRTLMDGPATAKDLINVSGLSRGTVYNYMKALKSEQCVYVCAWEKSVLNRDAIKVFALGKGKDAVKSKKSKAQIAAECRERKKFKILKDLGVNITPTETS